MRRNRLTFFSLFFALGLIWQSSAHADSPTLLNLQDYIILTQKTDVGVANEPGDEFGKALAAGDFNNDGFMDLAVGGPGEAPGNDPQSGTVFLFQGSGGGPTNGKYLTQKDAGGANELGENFGYSLATGDFNGDGFDDLAVGNPNEAPGNNPQSGAVFIFPGSSSGLTTGQFVTQKDAGGANEPGESFGYSLAAGDFNGDGFDDLAVGNPNEAPENDPQSGAVFIFPGSSSGLTTGLYVTQQDAGGGNEMGDAFGFSLAAGNFNGDTYDDLAIGTPKEAPGNDPKSGAVFVFPGSSSGLTTGQYVTQKNAGGANESGDEFGFSLAAGNFNGDNYDDLAIGTPKESPGDDPKSGAVFIFTGSDAGIHNGNVITQEDAGGKNEQDDQFGWALATGDLNGDGRDELVVGAPGEAPAGDPKSGAIFVFEEAGDRGFSGRHYTQKSVGEANETDDRFGRALTLGDFNAYGADDLAIGAPGKRPSADPKSGAVFYINGLPSAPVLTHGGLIGAVTDTQVKIWARANRASKLVVQYRQSLSPWKSSASLNLTSNKDFTGVVPLDNLTPHQAYDYRIVLNGEVVPGSQATFKTLKPIGVPGTVKFAIGADIGFPHSPYPIFDKIAENNPDFMILMGDHIYESKGMPDKKSAHERKYKENWAEKHLRKFMKDYSTFVTWDDHEIVNDWDKGKTGRYLRARPAYDEYQGQHNPAPRTTNEIYYSFRAGETDFYVLDTRSFRSPNKNVDDANKSMLGATQKADLKEWLARSKGKFKFIVSSVPWHEYGFTGNDSWKGFKTERSEIFQYIKDNEIRGVLLLSGDQHSTAILRLDEAEPYYLYEFSPTPLGYRRFGVADCNTQIQDIKIAHCKTQILFKNNSSRVYGFFSVDTTVRPAVLQFDVYDAGNTSLFHLEITENEISPSP